MQSSANVSGVGAAGPAQPLVAFRLDAVLRVQTESIDAHQTRLLTWLDDVRFSETASQKPADFASLAQELGQASGALLNDGSLQEVSVPPTWSNFAASISRTIVSALQYPSQATRTEVQESDATGQAKVRYDRSPECPSTDRCLSKTKLEYTALPIPSVSFNGAKSDLRAKVLGSKGALRLNPQGSLEVLTQDEHLEMPMGPMASLESTTRLELTRTTGAFASHDISSIVSQLRSMPATVAYTGPTRVNYDPLRIGDYTYAKALAEMEAVNLKDKRARATDHKSTGTTPAESSELQERAAPFRAMSAILRSQPEHIEQAVADIRKRGPAARTLIDALAMTETDAGAAALAGLLEDRTLPTDWRGAVASGLIRGGNTHEKTVQALVGTLGEPEIRVHALFGLGTISRKLAEAGDTARAESTIRVLTLLLGSKPSSVVAGYALRGISNSGATSALGVVEPYMKGPNASLRIAAVQALRLMRDAKATELLAERLLHDKDKSVRRAAADAASYQPPSADLITAMQNAVTSDPDVKVRKRLLETLVKWLPSNPELKDTLRLVEQEEKRASVREIAENGLSKKPRL
jgi:HEAT repeat protein